MAGGSESGRVREFGCEQIDLETKRKKRYYCSIELWIIAHWDRKIEDTSSELIEPFRKFIRYRFSFLPIEWYGQWAWWALLAHSVFGNIYTLRILYGLSKSSNWGKIKKTLSLNTKKLRLWCGQGDSTNNNNNNIFFWTSITNVSLSSHRKCLCQTQSRFRMPNLTWKRIFFFSVCSHLIHPIKNHVTMRSEQWTMSLAI